MGARRRSLGALACLLVIAAMASCAGSGGRADAEPSRGSPAAPTATADDGQASTRQSIAVIGDSFTSGSFEDSGAAARWPALLADEYTLATHAVSGTGYAATWQTGAGPSNYVRRVDEMPADEIEDVVFFGSINDGGFGYEATRAGAESAFERAREKWPDARILVVGPASPIWPVPDGYLAARDATRDAAAQAGLAFVDPIDEGWFEGERELIGSDGIHPNDDGHAYLADRLQEVFARHLPA